MEKPFGEEGLVSAIASHVGPAKKTVIIVELHPLKWDVPFLEILVTLIQNAGFGQVSLPRMAVRLNSLSKTLPDTRKNRAQPC